MTENQYECAHCKGVFEREWSDDEAKAEAAANGFDTNDCAIICDDCYHKIMPHFFGNNYAGAKEPT